MADVVDAATRSRMMSGIRGVNTKPERHVRSLLHREGFRFRLHARELPGRPDIVLPRYRAVIFVHGCFWHGHVCHLFRLPSTRPEFWSAKIERNKENDKAAIAGLQARGWRVATVWECVLKGRQSCTDAMIRSSLCGWLRGESAIFELTGRGDQGEA